MAFAGGLSVSGYDRKLADPATRAAKLADFAALRAKAAMTNREAVDGRAVILSLVTADQARAAADAAYHSSGQSA